MKLRDFVDIFTVVVYHANEREPGQLLQIGTLLRDYGLSFKQSWFPLIFHDGIFDQRFRSSRSGGDFEDQGVQISAEGIRWVEESVGEDNLERYLTRNGLRYPIATDSGTSEADQVRALDAQLAPAADREVTFGDNRKQIDDITSEIAKAEEAIRSSNEIEPEERNDSLVSLGLGRSLIQNCTKFTIGAFRYLVLDRIKKAFEKIIEDVFRCVLIAAFIAIALLVVSLI